MDPSQRWKEIGSKISYFSWIPHRDGRRLVVKHYIMDPSQRWKELGSKTLHFHGSQSWKEIGSKTFTEMEGDW